MDNLSTKTKWTLAGAGFAAALLLGCQGIGGDDSAGASNTQDTQSALLALDVKDSGDCAGLRARCARAHGAGNDSAVLIDTLINTCIIDTAKAHRLMEGGEGHHGRGPGDDFDGDDFHGPRLDSAARAALCDSLTAVVTGMDSTDSGYG